MDASESDERLMGRYRDGDAAAFEALYTRHRAPLFRFVRRQVASAELAEELFQDVWIRVIAARARYRPSARFTTWLYRIARNRLVDHYRRAAIRVADDAGDPDAVDTLAAHDGQQPERRAASADAMRTLAEHVAALPERQREAFLLREEAGMSIADIAAVTGVNPETAKSRLRYALARLREALSEHHD